MLRADRDTVEQDWTRIHAWLAERGLDLDLSQKPRQFSGGLANLNYLVSVDGNPFVLRRPPVGPLAEGANDMDREHRVLSRLPSAYPLAPRSIVLCRDTTVTGAPFQLIEYRPGAPLTADAPQWVARQAEGPLKVSFSLMDALAELHSVDPWNVKLENHGRPDGFLERQVYGWERRAIAAFGPRRTSAARQVVESLKANVPEDSRFAVIHGDFKCDNTLFEQSDLRPLAVLDWDLSTLGHPLFDLAVFLSYWVEPSDPTDVHLLQQSPALHAGFPSRRELIDRYLEQAPQPDGALAFCMTLARFRLAVVFRQLFQRHHSGAVRDPYYASFHDLSLNLLTWTAESLKDPF